MSDFRVWCFCINHEKNPIFRDIFSVTVGSDACIEDLTEKVKEKLPNTLRHVHASMLIAWRCTDSEIDFGDMDSDNFNDRLNKVFKAHEKEVKKLDLMQGVEQFRDQTLLIEVPELNELRYPVAAKKRKRDSDTSSASNKSQIDDFKLMNDEICRRKDTVSALWKRLINDPDRLIMARGPPGSGKTTLARLLQSYIQTVDPSRNVVFVGWWPLKDYNDPKWSWEEFLVSEGWIKSPGVETIFIFDTAQMTYADDRLWLSFFKNLELVYARAIAFATYGSATQRILIRDCPIDIRASSRITLRPVDHNDGLPSVGILFTEKEYWDLIQRHYHSSHFDETFFRNVFEVTGGHVGAILGFIQAVAIDTSYKDCERTNAQYTWSTFRQAFSTDEFMRRLTHTSGAFTRGLPLDEDVQEYTKSRALSAAVDRSPLTADIVKDDIQEGLEQCAKRGWLHTDTVRDKDGTESVGYFFASRLHQWFVEWQLFNCRESPIPLQIDLLEFVLSIIRLFDPAILSEERRIGPACIQRPPETQYQDEFYRCSFKHPCGTYLSFPESGAVKGQAKFYVPSKKWGIELLRDGNQLEEYSGVFSPTGAFDGTLLNDNIILDFRSSSPGLAHPNLQKLYHVVFDDNYETVRVLDNSLQPIPGGEFRLSRS